MDSEKQLVQAQFEGKGAAYAQSAVHAKGASLGRLVELVAPGRDWRVLDVATAAGHTALKFAPLVGRVVASDLTVGMLTTAKGLAAERGVGNLFPAGADAEALPFAANSFDCVTCRIAPHHFPHIDRFVAECGRVLRPGGILAVVDNVVPGGRKKQDQATGRYINAFEKLRDPSHVRCLSLYEWRELFRQQGFTLRHEETAPKAMDFGDWVARMNVPAGDVTRLRVMLVQAPAGATQFLTPIFGGDRITFHLVEAILIGQK